MDERLLGQVECITVLLKGHTYSLSGRWRLQPGDWG